MVSFKPVEENVNSMEQKTQVFCQTDVQEFNRWTRHQILQVGVQKMRQLCACIGAPPTQLYTVKMVSYKCRYKEDRKGDPDPESFGHQLAKN
jgi:hypothetical protein